jgi:hypothetical protein
MNMVRICALALMLVAAPAIATQPSKIGTWHLDLSRSTMVGAPSVSDVRTYEDAGHGLVRSTHVTTSAAGVVSKTIYTAREDGRAYPMTDAAGHDAGSIAIVRRGPLTQGFVTRRDGKVNANGTTTLSADGKTLTMVIAIEGQPTNVITLFTRVD